MRCLFDSHDGGRFTAGGAGHWPALHMWDIDQLLVVRHTRVNTEAALVDALEVLLGPPTARPVVFDLYSILETSKGLV